MARKITVNKLTRRLSNAEYWIQASNYLMVVNNYKCYYWAILKVHLQPNVQIINIFEATIQKVD